MPNTHHAATTYNQLNNACQAILRGVPFASFEPQPNGDVLVVGDPDTLYAYIKPMAEHPRQVARGVMLKKREANLIACIPLRLETLASGAVLEWHIEGVGVRGNFTNGYYDGYLGVAERLEDLERYFIHDFGPDQYRTVFGKEPAAAHVEEYQAQQAAIAKRKADNEAAESEQRMEYARRTNHTQLLTAEELQQLMQENVEQAARAEATSLESWLTSVGAGVVDNARYQAYLDTVEDVVSLARQRSNAGYFAFINARQAVYSCHHGSMPWLDATAWQTGFTEYCRRWGDEHLSERAKHLLSSAPVRQDT